MAPKFDSLADNPGATDLSRLTDDEIREIVYRKCPPSRGCGQTLVIPPYPFSMLINTMWLREEMPSQTDLLERRTRL